MGGAFKDSAVAVLFDSDKLDAINSFIHKPDDIAIPLIPNEENDGYISLDGHTRLYAAVQKGFTRVRGFISSTGDYIYSFANEAKKRGVTSADKLVLASHDEYEIVWNKFCDEFFKSRENSIGIAMENEYKILIVEDDVTISEAIEREVKRWGIDAMRVSDFSDVLTEFSRYQPHLVLLDAMLPMYNGYHWCSEIRKISRVPIVFISSASDNMNIIMAMNMGADDFISKPIDLDVMSAKIHAVLRRCYESKNYRHIWNTAAQD